VRLLPCDILARIAPLARQVAQFEVELAQRLAETQSPVAALEPRVEPRAYERDSFVVTLWTHYPSVTPREVAPADYAKALERFPLGLNRDSQVPRKGGVLAGDSVSGMRHDQAIFDGSAGACG